MAEARRGLTLADYIAYLREQGEWKKAEMLEKTQAERKEKK
jgi:hypothetical protein